MPDRELVEQGKPEGAELVDVVVGRLILLKHCADQARHANEHQQTDRKAHRAQQFADVRAKATRGGRMSHRRRIHKNGDDMNSVPLHFSLVATESNLWLNTALT